MTNHRLACFGVIALFLGSLLACGKMGGSLDGGDSRSFASDEVMRTMDAEASSGRRSAARRSGAANVPERHRYGGFWRSDYGLCYYAGYDPALEWFCRGMVSLFYRYDVTWGMWLQVHGHPLHTGPLQTVNPQTAYLVAPSCKRLTITVTDGRGEVTALLRDPRLDFQSEGQRLPTWSYPSDNQVRVEYEIKGGSGDLYFGGISRGHRPSVRTRVQIGSCVGGPTVPGADRTFTLSTAFGSRGSMSYEGVDLDGGLSMEAHVLQQPTGW